MQIALEEAKKAFDEGEVPVGALIVKDHIILAQSHNYRETLNDSTAHAEMLAIREASRASGSWRLNDATIYVTLEPCPMCAGAMVQARIKRLVYGAKDPKAGAVESLYNIVQDKRLNHRMEVTPGIMAEECASFLKSFFKGRR